jgi:hypothetical protein
VTRDGLKNETTNFYRGRLGPHKTADLERRLTALELGWSEEMKPTKQRVQRVEDKLGADDYQPLVVEVDRTIGHEDYAPRPRGGPTSCTTSAAGGSSSWLALLALVFQSGPHKAEHSRGSSGAW